jgi:hypothetical protein
LYVMFRADCGDLILSLIKKIELVTFLVFVLESFLTNGHKIVPISLIKRRKNDVQAS